MSSAFARLITLTLAAFLFSACGKKNVAIDDAHEPKTLVLQSNEEVAAVEIEINGLLTGYARVLLVNPDTPDEPLETIELQPVMAGPMPIGIQPKRIKLKYANKTLQVRYEPGKKMTGHLEITYEFIAP